ncbi:Thioredoxin-like fold [Pseudocohnilembus persalinus]|uniref:Large ribosomal subunit protein mL43 n=1 Tax=Pseudocohnilembus persalinus TaxID=266149 RepID=A0A0V0QH15_PSEPJ|nr:Thioredoxin-like fold [Pseudocohnilembus persalinus]|eukprot:KRX01486.1 Thioredoxin-like fold [Pseudocohnilembus persalinus]
MTENPQIEFEFYKRRNHHPYISSTYINGYVKDFPLLNLSEDDIIEALNRVKNQSGRKFLPHKGQRVYGTKKSVQGMWNENLWNKQPEVELEKLRGPEKPDIQFELIDRDTNKSKYVYHKDIVKSFLKQQDKKWEKGEYL